MGMGLSDTQSQSLRWSVLEVRSDGARQSRPSGCCSCCCWWWWLTLGAGVHAWRQRVGGRSLWTVRLWRDVRVAARTMPGSAPDQANAERASSSHQQNTRSGVPKWRVNSNQLNGPIKLIKWIYGAHRCCTNDISPNIVNEKHNLLCFDYEV
jgi:hypothetical protein